MEGRIARLLAALYQVPPLAAEKLELTCSIRVESVNDPPWASSFIDRESDPWSKSLLRRAHVRAHWQSVTVDLGECVGPVEQVDGHEKVRA